MEVIGPQGYTGKGARKVHADFGASGVYRVSGLGLRWF